MLAYDRNSVLSALKKRKAGFTLEQFSYSSPESYAADLEYIFYKQWLFAIVACEVASPGDYVTYKVGDYSVIILRDNEGQVKAFHNSCRHRGSLICTESKGRSPKLVCPYHRWTYDLDGKLIFARDVGKDFDYSSFGLRPVHCEIANGIVYICLADDPPDFTEFQSQSLSYLQPHDLTNAKVAFETTTLEHGNWKLVFENNRECYHCAGNHPSLCKTFPRNPAGIAEDTVAASESDFHKTCAKHNLPSQFLENDIGSWRLTRVPLLEGAKSYTMDGSLAVSKPLGRVPPEAGVLLLYSYPNSWNHFLTDHSILFRITPVGPNATELTTKWLVHKEAKEGTDYDLGKLTKVWVNTNAEDKRIIENNQQGVNSPAYRPGPYTAIEEAGTKQFTDWYCALMVDALNSSS